MRFSFGSNGSPFGSGSPFEQQTCRKKPAKGADLVYELSITLKEAATGTQKTVSFQHQGRTENISVKIPKGMITGKKLRVAGKGQSSHYPGGTRGDLFIKTNLQTDPVFKNKGNDLYLTMDIKLTRALLGTTISVPTLMEKQLNLKIPPGTKHKTRMRLPGFGLPYMAGEGQGDLYAEIHIDIPETLTNKQKKLVEQLASAGL
jgi:curved DNA-binding protein